MNEQQFLDRVYDNIRVGMKIIKPRKVSKVLSITESGNIYYRIGTTNQKAVTREQLQRLHAALSAGPVSTQSMSEIAGAGRPCNVTTFKWILREFGLAVEGVDGLWRRAW